MAANAQGKFFPMYDLLFANQAGEGLTRPKIDEYAQKIGLDMDKFKKDVDSNAYQAKIKADQDLAQSIGMGGTPAFVINGKKLSGAQPPAQFEANHLKTGDFGQGYDTVSFAGTAVKPANHIPTNAPCAQCHTTPGNNAVYSVTGTHVGVTSCLGCHAPAVAGTFANVTIVSTPANHIPIGALDCNGSGCHTTTNVNPAGFKLGAANVNAPTLSVAGHTTVAGAVAACQTCHEAAGFLGMMPGSATVAGDSRPSSALDAKHPASGDCGGCHSTTPTFAANVTGAGKPANHIQTNATCAQCHTTADNSAR
jgi:hypothetical protein